MNSMRMLLAKDFRLSLDALLTWGLIVGGFVLGAAGLSQLPESLKGDAIASLDLESVLLCASVGVAITAVAAGAWGAAVVAQGDRAHGADHLMAALPVPPGRRIASKLAASAVMVVAPALCAAALFGGVMLLSARQDHSAGMLLALLGLTAGAATVGCGLGLGVAPLVRGAFPVVAVALLLGGAGAAMAFLASTLSFNRAAAGLTGYWRSVEDLHASGVLDGSRQFASGVATLAGAVTTGVTALVIGVLALGRALPTRRVVATVGAGLVLAFASGVAFTYASLGQDRSLQETMAWRQWRLHGMSNDELLAITEAAHHAPATAAQTVELGFQAPLELWRRLDTADPAERGRIMSALLAMQNDRTMEDAVIRLCVLPPGAERIERTAHVVRQYPATLPQLVDQLLRSLRPHEAAQIPGWTADRDAEAARARAQIELLRRLQADFPGQREALQVLIDDVAASQDVVGGE